MAGSQSDKGSVTRTNTEADLRFVRLRRLAWLLDRSISIGGYRIGLDPLVGLIPGAGDLLGAGMSAVILYDAARLGIPARILMKMCGNVLLELIVGTVPLLGDVFDFAWRANVRNLNLVEKYYDPIRAQRPPTRIIWAIGLAIVAILGAAVIVSVLVIGALWRAIDRVGP